MVSVKGPMRGCVIVLAVMVWVTLLSSQGHAQGHEFVGAKMCSMCHKKMEEGNQYGIWQESKHAHAYETLGTPEAKEAGAKRGVDDPQQSGKCLKCHSTAYNFTEEKVTEKVAVTEGVSCESCHGAGKDYMKKSTMQDQAQAVAAGLVIPDDAVCKKCHNEESPSYKPFDYNAYSEKIKHPVPAQQ